VAAQASNPIRRGQNLLSRLTDRILGPDPDDQTARTRAQAESNVEALNRLFRANQENRLDAGRVDAALEEIMRPGRTQDAETVARIGLQAREGEASIQGGLDTSRTDNLLRAQGGAVDGADRLMRTGADVQNTVTRGQHESFSDFTAPHIKELAQMGIGADQWMHGAHFGKTPVSEQILGHVAGQTAADRDFALQMAQQERPLRFAELGLRAGALAGLLFGKG